jgi:hypothetical protein
VINIQTLCSVESRFAYEADRKRSEKIRSDMIARVVHMRTVENKTLQDIGDAFGFTREYARQLLKSAGVDPAIAKLHTPRIKAAAQRKARLVAAEKKELWERRRLERERKWAPLMAMLDAGATWTEIRAAGIKDGNTFFLKHHPEYARRRGRRKAAAS